MFGDADGESERPRHNSRIGGGNDDFDLIRREDEFAIVQHRHDDTVIRPHFFPLDFRPTVSVVAEDKFAGRKLTR